MIKMEMFNPDAINDGKIFKQYWSNFCNYCRTCLDDRWLILNDSNFIDILVENEVLLIDDELYAENEEAAIAFILRWS